MSPWTGPGWARSVALVGLVALLLIVPTTGDFGLTWDEPAYRYSQILSGQWWERLVRVRSAEEFRALVDPQTLLFYWPYGRHGFNFHPPLAGQLNLLTYEVFGGFVDDLSSRRLASTLEFASAIALIYAFLAKRYGGLAVRGGRLVAPDAPCLRRCPPDRHRHPRHADLGGRRVRLLERAAAAGRP